MDVPNDKVDVGVLGLQAYVKTRNGGGHVLATRDNVQVRDLVQGDLDRLRSTAKPI